MIRCAVFDFDGTLVLSNAIKRAGFFAVTADFPDSAAAMARLLADPPGDRFAIFGAFAAQYGADAEELCGDYGAWCETKILACPERGGATAILEELRRRNLRIYVNSATPEEPLKALVARRYAPSTFDGVLGGHRAKLANLVAIAAAEGLRPDNILMIGDGIDDKAAATAFGCGFAGVADGTLAATVSPGPLISDLMGLEAPFGWGFSL